MLVNDGRKCMKMPDTPSLKVRCNKSAGDASKMKLAMPPNVCLATPHHSYCGVKHAVHTMCLFPLQVPKLMMLFLQFFSGLSGEAGSAHLRVSAKLKLFQS